MKNQHLFRKTSLQRLRSPERLDQAVRLIQPLDWLALSVIGLLLLLALIWNFL
jgi:HlyD family secretion protein